MHEPLAQLLERTYSAAERAVIYRLIRGSRQVRHFAADPIPQETLQRILEAALEAPFMGAMPPWQLILITSPALRARVTAAVEEGHARDALTRPMGYGHEPSEAVSRDCLAEARCIWPSPTIAAMVSLWGLTEARNPRRSSMASAG
jgi:nitroreductase